MSEHESQTGDALPIVISETLEQVGGDEEFLAEILSLYQEDYSEQHKRLEMALAEEDFETIRKTGHSLKGSSSNLSMPPLTEISRAIEQAGEEQDIDRVRALINDLDREYTRLIEWLAQR